MTEETYNYTFYMIHRKGRNIIDIYDEEDGEHYIGSTRHFKTRIYEHLCSEQNVNGKNYNLKVYNHIRSTGGFDEWIISTIETHDNITKKEAHIHERWLIELYGSQLNTYKPARTKEDDALHSHQYYINNKEKLSKKNKQYQKENYDRLYALAKIRVANDRDRINATNRRYQHRTMDYQIARQREYRNRNREKVNANQQRYRKENKLILTEKRHAREAKKKLEKEQNIFATQDGV
jgi:hypothetical protein